jgi:hypothetical protein
MNTRIRFARHIAGTVLALSTFGTPAAAAVRADSLGIRDRWRTSVTCAVRRRSSP